jgi:hypothetical protein
MPIGIARNLSTWQFQDTYVERVMDNAAYTSAHPDDTLVLAGPSRSTDAQSASTGTAVGSLLAIGMMQNMNISQVKATTPVMAIGSGRSFFVSGKAQGNGSIARLFVNGRNLLRVLYHNAQTSSINVGNLDDKPADKTTSQFYINLDSELYYVPFGLGTIFRTKAHDFVGGFYTELTMIQSYNIGIQAGANMIAEQVSFMFDRLMPWSAGSAAKAGTVPRATLDAIAGFADPDLNQANTPSQVTDNQISDAGTII